MNSVATDNSQYIPFGVSPVDVMGSSDAGDNYSNSSKKIVRGKRRRMVMECKSLRSQVRFLLFI